MILRSNSSQFDIPLFLSEIPLRNYIGFKRQRQKWHKSIMGGEETEPLLDILPMLVKGDLSELPLYSESDTGEIIGLDFQGELSLFGIYAHLIKMIDAYVPNPEIGYSFGWYDENGEKCTYYAEPDRAKRLYSRKAYTVGETVELEEFERKYTKAIKDNSEGEELDEWSADKQGNLAFWLSTRKMAILARKEGERLPFNATHRAEFVEGRAKVFEDIPLDVYLNVCFFLKTTVEGLMKELTLPRSTTQPKNHFTVVRTKGNPITKH